VLLTHRDCGTDRQPTTGLLADIMNSLVFRLSYVRVPPPDNHLTSPLPSINPQLLQRTNKSQKWSSDERCWSVGKCEFKSLSRVSWNTIKCFKFKHFSVLSEVEVVLFIIPLSFWTRCYDKRRLHRPDVKRAAGHGILEHNGLQERNQGSTPFGSSAGMEECGCDGATVPAAARLICRFNLFQQEISVKLMT